MYERYRHIHFVGVGGIGMSGIAELLLNLGYTVSGSDVRESDLTRRLSGLGARIAVGHRAENVEGAHVVVYSSAVSPENPELLAARAHGKIPVIRRAEMLAELMRLKYAVLVAGAHGKTTTTSMVATVLAGGGLDPTVVIGGKLNAWGTNAKLGQGAFVVAEADESDGSFLLLSPTIAVVTNIDREHLDYYSGIEHIRETFLAFVNKVPFYGQAVLCLDDPNVRALLPQVAKRFTTYGFSPEADFTAREVCGDGFCTRYKAFRGGGELGEIELRIPGRHNVLNSLAAVAVGCELEMPFDAIRAGLDAMTGVQRRFQMKGEEGGVTVLDDYGHHPTEIRAVLSALTACFPGRRRVVAFQPHRYTRTKALMGEFATCFSDCDELLVTAIYPASEPPIPGVTGEALADAIARSGHSGVAFCETFDMMLERLLRMVRPGDVVVTLGAGSVFQVGERLLLALREAPKGA